MVQETGPTDKKKRIRICNTAVFRISDLLTDETTRFLFFILASRSEEDRFPGLIFLPNFFRTLPLLPENEKSFTIRSVSVFKVYAMVHV